MKTLFIILKATTGITLIAPTSLSVTQDFEKYGSQDENETLNQVVNTSTADSKGSVLNSVLKRPQGQQNEDFDNFKNNNMQHETYPGQKKTQGQGITNDDNSRVTTGADPSYGLADDRFSGGLLFDIGAGTDGFNQKAQKTINKVYKNGVVGDSNAVSINHVMSPDRWYSSGTSVGENDTGMTQKILDANNFKGDVHPSNQRDKPTTSKYQQGYQDIHQNFENTKNPNPDTGAHPIVNDDDFNYTPDNISTATGSQVSQTKETIKTLFNEELYDWYWTTWNREYDVPSVADANNATASAQEQALDKSGLTEDIKLGLNLSWNQLMDEGKQDSDSPWYAKLPKDVGLGVLGTVLDTIVPGLGGVATGFLDALLPDPNPEIYKDVSQYYNYYSAAFGYSFWNKFFDQYLGTPDGSTGLINKYYQEHGKIPSDISINDFDFYTPFSDINITSTHRWVFRQYPGDFKSPVHANYSSSKFDLSKLALNLGVDFNLTRTDPTIDQLLTKLQNEYNGSNPLKLPLSGFTKDTSGSYKGKYYVDDKTDYSNEQLIIEYLDDHGFQQLDPGLTLEGQFIPGQASKIEATYNNGRTVPIYVDIS